MSLKLINLSKVYPDGTKALHQINLSIDNGLFGLLGPNGAGKSTLMRILATLQTPTEGQIQLDEFDIHQEKMQLRQRLGYLPQEFGLIPHLSAWQMMEHFAILKGIDRADVRKQEIHTLLERTNLTKDKNTKLQKFSGGMKQRLGIALSLLGNPRLVIVDEPTAGLDPKERIKFLNILGDLGEEKIVLVSTHIIEDVNNTCSRLAIINKGNILFAGSPEEAISTLQDRVWLGQFSKQQWKEIKMAHHTISKITSGTKVLARIYAERQPKGFNSIEPSLEDFYLLKIQETNEN